MSALPAWVFYAVLLMLAIFFVERLNKSMRDESNPLSWWHFIASKGKDGTFYADITKLGQALGIVLVIWIAVALSARVKELDWMGFCAILGLVLSYLAGVQAFQAYLKSKKDTAGGEK